MIRVSVQKRIGLVLFASIRVPIGVCVSALLT